MIGQKLGPYQILSKLGEGGMGEVYLAHDPRLDRDVALKLLPVEVAGESRPPPAPGSAEARSADDRRARFQREARAAAALNHPNICTIHEVGEADGRAYIAMEYLEGATLSECLATGPSPMPVGELLDIAAQIADALDTAHARQIVHRDLKSANIVLLPRGQVKVLDFGLAKRIPGSEAPGLHSSRGPELHSQSTALPDRPPSTTYLATEAGLVVGTAAYMAPEQALGQPVDARSDLFSFGVVLYELLTGRLPFAGRTPMELLNAVVNATPAPIPRYNDEVPDTLVAVVTKLLAKDPAARYQSAREVLADLKRLRTTGTAAAPPWTDTRPAWWRRPRWIAATAAVLAVAGLALVLWISPGAPVASPTGTVSLVVLPAAVFSGDPQAEFLKDAVATWLTADLLQVGGLDMKAPPNSTRLEGVDDEDRVAEVYGVDRYVTSKLFVENRQASLTVLLVERGTRRPLWSEKFEGTPDDYQGLVRRASNGLRLALQPASAPVAATPAGDKAVDVVFRQGEYYWNRYNHSHDPADFDRALGHLTRTLDLDANHADAAAMIAFLHIFRLEAGASPDEVRPEIARWARRAVELGTRSGLAWSAMSAAEVTSAAPDHLKSLEYTLRAAWLAPRTAIVHVGVAFSGGIHALGLEAARRSWELDPTYLWGASNLADRLIEADRLDEALALTDEMLHLQPGFFAAQTSRLAVMARRGRTDDAAALLEAIRSSPTPVHGQYLFPAAYYATHPRAGPAGDRAAADLETFVRQEASFYGCATLPYVLPVLVEDTRVELAFHLLQLCHDRDQLPPFDWLVGHPGLDALRRDSRFASIAGRARDYFVRALRVFDEAARRGELPDYLVGPLREVHAKTGM